MIPGYNDTLAQSSMVLDLGALRYLYLPHPRRVLRIEETFKSIFCGSYDRV